MDIQLAGLQEAARCTFIIIFSGGKESVLTADSIQDDMYNTRCVADPKPYLEWFLRRFLHKWNILFRFRCHRLSTRRQDTRCVLPSLVTSMACTSYTGAVGSKCGQPQKQLPAFVTLTEESLLKLAIVCVQERHQATAFCKRPASKLGQPRFHGCVYKCTTILQTQPCKALHSQQQRSIVLLSPLTTYTAITKYPHCAWRLQSRKTPSMAEPMSTFSIVNMIPSLITASWCMAQYKIASP